MGEQEKNSEKEKKKTKEKGGDGGLGGNSFPPPPPPPLYTPVKQVMFVFPLTKLTEIYMKETMLTGN